MARVIGTATHGAIEAPPVTVSAERRAELANAPPVPAIDSDTHPRWTNAYDVADVVALIHPLRDHFQGGSQVIRDVVTHNPTGPHSIEDYLSDPGRRRGRVGRHRELTSQHLHRHGVGRSSA